MYLGFYKEQLRSVGIKVFRLVVDILLLAWEVVRKVVLPARGRKGNILSSLHDLYIGLVDRVAAFERGILPRSVVFDNRYVKRALVLVSCFLFLLSSLEWMPARLGTRLTDDEAVVAVRASERLDRPAQCFYQATRLDSFGEVWLPVAVAACSPPLPEVVPRGKRWVLFRVFRI